MMLQIKKIVQTWRSGKSARKLRRKIKFIMADLRDKIEQTEAEADDFPRLYSQVENPDESLSITHFGLNVKTSSSRRPEDKGTLLLELSVYQIPIPYKGGILLSVGTKEKILNSLKQPETMEKILKYIPRLAAHFDDLR